MGLTKESTGSKCIDNDITVNSSNYDITVALAGNPNVGKSTVFNELTGLHQHTGNWPGKTVTGAKGSFTYKDKQIQLIDIPGCYSLIAHSVEEEIARDFICFGGADRTVVVCDATCLERNLALVLQTIEISGSCIMCINLADEAKARNIDIDTDHLKEILDIPIVTTAARSGEGLEELCDALLLPKTASKCKVKYPDYIETAISMITPVIELICKKHNIMPRWLALRLAEGSAEMFALLKTHLGAEIESVEIQTQLENVNKYLEINGISKRKLSDTIATSALIEAGKTAKQCVTKKENKTDKRNRKIDRILTGKITAFPLMLILLAGIFYITISGANIPSGWLNRMLFDLEAVLYNGSISIGIPTVICEAFFHGVFRTLAWVVSVMLPPMAIFFPLFTLLEDAGILPRIAFNLDHAFSKCKACGKQSLTMCMGFGCNAAGIIGCRIIDSPRERLIAIITNSLVPCNGRFPGIISMIAMFFVLGGTLVSNLFSALLLTGFIVLGIIMTFVCSKLLSSTVLKGVPSSFTLEMPPYRRPQFFRVLVHSIFDRTLFVLMRAVAVAAPAGLIIWILANITVGDTTLLQTCTGILDPFARIFGLDGVILTAFILGFPANEIVIPIMLMAYTANGTLTEISDIAAIRSILIDNGWNILTALNFILFSLMHFPCSTTLMTIRRETGSAKWTFVSFILPTVVGLIMCFITHMIYILF